MTPNAYIIAGPNGAGKTTFAREFLPNYADCRNFINADLIAQGLAPFAPASAAFKAGRLVLEETHTMIQARIDFGFETHYPVGDILERFVSFALPDTRSTFFISGFQPSNSRFGESRTAFV